MRGRLVPHGIAARVVLLWAALGLLAGAAVGALVHLTMRSPTGEVVYHGRYTQQSGVSISRAYSSTLNITFDGQHHRDLAVFAGLAIGVLAGLVVGLVFGARTRPTGPPAPA